jgi:hypothetical protein
VPRPSGTNVVTGKKIFKHKLKADGSLDRYKARWVLQDFTQRPGVDYDETFSPAAKPGTIRTVLTSALSQAWSVHHLDVKNAFLHGTLTETVYCSQPVGCGPGSPRHGLQAQEVPLRPQAGSPSLVQSLRHLLALTGLCRGQGGHLRVRLSSWPGYCVPPLRRQHCPHGLLPRPPVARHLLSSRSSP